MGLSKARLAEALPVAAIGLCAFTVPRTEGIQQAVGPWVFPWAAGAGLLVCAGVLAFATATEGSEPVAETRRFSALWLLAAAAAYILLISGVGFIPAASLSFFLVTRAFGSSRPVREALTGIVFAVACHGLFTSLLGVRLGPAFAFWN